MCGNAGGRKVDTGHKMDKEPGKAGRGWWSERHQQVLATQVQLRKVCGGSELYRPAGHVSGMRPVSRAWTHTGRDVGVCPYFCVFNFR